MKILFPLLVAVFLISCSDDSKTSSATSTAKKEILKQVNETAKQVQKSTKAVVEQVKIVTKKSVEKVKKSGEKVVKEVAHQTAEVAKKVELRANEVAKPSIDASKLFAKCAGCHGPHAERKALGKSQVIQGWSEEKIVTALHGYKDGSYGGSMKGVMKSQISGLSDDEIKALATHISKL